MTSIVSSSCIQEVSFLPTEQMAHAISTLRLWKRYCKHTLSHKVLDERSMSTYRDFKLVLRLVQTDMVNIQTKGSRGLIVVKDNTSQIQAMLSLRIEESSLSKSLSIHVCHLITAPWNLRFNVTIYDKPLHGAGVVALVGALVFGKKIGASELSLSSTRSAKGFYEKIGMKREFFLYYRVKINELCLRKIAEAFKKVHTYSKEKGIALGIKT